MKLIYLPERQLRKILRATQRAAGADSVSAKLIRNELIRRRINQKKGGDRRGK